VLAALPELSLQIVGLAREHSCVTIGEAIRLPGVSRNTLKQHFRTLVERGYLNPARQQTWRLVRTALKRRRQ
jgi:Fic family protein